MPREPQRSADLPEKLLIISCSARMLAQSAARAGIRVVTLDHYADADTRASAAVSETVPFQNGGFDPPPLVEAALRLAPGKDYPLVYGSGLDTQPDLLEAFAKSHEVIGNSPAIQRLFRSPPSFFGLLRHCGISYPEIRHERPARTENWLIKSGCSEGGKRVRFCAQDQAGPEDYYQKRLHGPALSALFLADGREAKVIGFNTLWTSASPTQPFLFAGAMNHAPLDARLRQQVKSHIITLVKASGIKGLNSLDFMIDSRDELQVLEVNARPSATMALYDQDAPEGLLAAHIRACRGELAFDAAASSSRAFRVIFAPKRVISMASSAWPAWCADLPVSGSPVVAGEPLCTVRAEGGNPIEAERLLEARLNQLSARLSAAHPSSS